MTDYKFIIIISLLAILTATGCVLEGSTGASGKTKPEAEVTAPQAPPDKSPPPKKTFYQDVAQRLHAAADEWQGTRHCLGGSSKQCTDCSGLVQRLYADLFAVALPRRSADQGRAGRQVAREALQPGDVLYFNPPSHSGIYLGENEFLHTSTRKGVMISHLDTDPYWNKRFVRARRVLKPE